MSPKISVIIPVYQAKSYLPGLFSCLNQQTFSDYEVLAVNNCSTDGSRDDLLSMMHSDSRWRVLDTIENRGPSSARNVGLDHARGDYITYIDSDDSIVPEYFEILFSAADKFQADMCVSNYISRFPGNDVFESVFRTMRKDRIIMTGMEALRGFKGICAPDCFINVMPWGKLIRRDVIERGGLRHRDHLTEDNVMTFMQYLNSEKVVFVENYGYIYNRCNIVATSRSSASRYAKEMHLAPAGIIEGARHFGAFDELEQLITRFYFSHFINEYQDKLRLFPVVKDLLYSVGEYRKLLPEMNINGSEDYIRKTLSVFYAEMAAVGMEKLFFYFIEPHKKILEPVLTGLF